MALTKKLALFIVALILVSLTGLVLLQLSLLRTAMEQKEVVFDRNVLSALAAVVRCLEEQEATATALEYASDSLDREISIIAVIGHDERYEEGYESPSFIGNMSGGIPEVSIEDGVLRCEVPTAQRVMVQIRDEVTGHDSVLVDSFMPSGEHHLVLDTAVLSGGRYVVNFSSDSGSYLLSFLDGALGAPGDSNGNDSGRFDLVRRVVSRLTTGVMRPLRERINESQLDTLLELNLIESGIELEYAFGVYEGADDTLWMAVPSEQVSDLRSSGLRTRLYPNDLFPTTAELVVFFPERENFLYWQIGPELAATTLFVIIILFCFVYTVRIIIAQRRNADLMVEFVNNMTHEFKTPISTVALACEAILRPDIISQEDKVADFSRMIQSENQRMRNQTDKILQMAALEERDYELAWQTVDLHELLSAAVEGFALQVKHRHGQIDCDLAAERYCVSGDKVHLAAVIHSVLDNANKYSPEKPLIAIRTGSDAKGLSLTIEDRGMGIPADDLKRVFDKYYRVSSGNRHDVKGFGLGLSYVDLIVRAHGGTIALDSRLGRGTSLTITLPFEQSGQKRGQA